MVRKVRARRSEKIEEYCDLANLSRLIEGQGRSSCRVRQTWVQPTLAGAA